MSKKRFGRKINLLIKKARESAILAVNVYNNPSSIFRSSAFIVLMNIAWTSLFHAIYEKKNVKYFYKNQKDKRKYIRINGEPKTWDLSQCSSEYFKDGENPIYKNIQFFVGIRNKIEHKFIPEIDQDIFGECQSYLINFEEILIDEFGKKYALADTLLFALQYSRIRSDEQLKAIKKVQSKHFKEVKQYIDSYRKNLNDSIYADPRYCFRVFLIPKPSNRKSTSDLAIEFVKYDPCNPNEMKKYEHITTIIKEKKIPVELEKKISLTVDPSDTDKYIVVDRDTKKEVPKVGITKNPNEANGILLIEKLSDELFNDASKIVEAGLILKKRFNYFPFSERTLYFLYGNRNEISSRKTAELLFEASFDNYIPFYHWLMLLDQRTIAVFFEESLKKMNYPRIHALFKLFSVLDTDSWFEYVDYLARRFKQYTQKPGWYWLYYNMKQRRKNSENIYATLNKGPSVKILGIEVKELINDQNLTNQKLTEECLKLAAGKGNHYDVRDLDLISCYNKLNKILPKKILP